MSASISNAQTPPIAATQNAAAATAPSGPSANVAAGSAQPTARSYASATKKVSSPPIASSAAPPVAVGGPQSAQHGKSSSISPVNGKNPLQPAVPAIVNGTPSQGDHSRKSSVTITAAGATGYIPNGGPVASRAPSGLTFGAISGSPAPSHAAPHHPQGATLNPQTQNPRIASPAHSPSPIPQYSGGKPNNLPGRPEISFGGGGEAEQNTQTRPISMPPQPNNALPQAQHLRRESSQSAHSDMSNPAFNSNRGFANGGRGGRGYNPGGYNPQMGHNSPTPYRTLPNQPRGGMAPAFQPQGPMHPNSPYRQNRSPAMPPAQLANPAMNNYYNPHAPYQPNPYSMPPVDPFQQFYSGQPYGLQQSIHAHYPGGVPPSPGRGYQMPYNVPYQQPPNMSRTPSQASERPPSAVNQPSTPAMTNVNHVSHTPSASVGASPAPSSSTFTIPAKKASKAIVIKNADGEVVNFDKKAASPAPAAPAPHASQAPPAAPRSPAIVQTPTPPPRAPSAADSSHSQSKTAEEKRAEFVEKVKANLLKEEAEKKGLAAKAEAEKKGLAAKVEAEKKELAAKAEAEKKELAAKAEAEKKELAAKAEAEKKQKEEAAKKAEAERQAAEKAEAEKKAEEERQKKAEEDEEFERQIREMEEKERLEEERERAYNEKKKLEDEAKKKFEAEQEDERLRKLEREAEERELVKSSQSSEKDAEAVALFASLKKSQFGPQQTSTTDSGASTPTAEPTAEPAAETTEAAPPAQLKPTAPKNNRPAALKLETNKSVEPPQMTAGMTALKSSRFLQVKNELAAYNYPEGVSSPNPALNLGAKKGRQYDKDFLLQFQEVFKEKPSLDWDSRLKETVGDSSDSARPQSARPSSMMGGRQPSRSAMAPAGGAMGNFAQSFGGRTLPPGTTSEQRFQQANHGGRPVTMTNPLASFVGGGPSNRPGAFPMGAPMARSSSFQNMAAPNSPRVGSSRGRNSRRGGNNKQEEQLAKAMPLTANLDSSKLVLEKSTTGWKPHSQAPQNAAPAGHMAPDMVQRKVKSNLNKLTPEKFDRISDQILEIAAQSKDETDGRTLRQVIQLTFEKACDEAHWAAMYAKFCHKMLATMSPEIRDENVKDKKGDPVVGGALFRKYLLNRCQEEFERGWEVNLPDKPEGGEVMLSDEYYIAAAAKRKGLGLIQFIGELYKLRMLTLRIMHECVLKLLDFEGLPDESAIESLVKLLRTVGATVASEEAGPKMLQVYFERIEKVAVMPALPSRLRFMLMDIVDLRKAGWKAKDDAFKGPKTLQEIHQEAAAAQQAAEMERVRSNQRGGPRPGVGRGDARSFSGGGMLPPQDFPSGRVQMDDLRKLSRGVSGRNLNTPGQLGPSMLGSRSSSGRRGLGPGGLMGRGEESGASSRTNTPPTQKEKESTTHVNSFSALAALENEGAGEVGSPPSTASSPPVQKAAPAVETKEAKPSA